MSVLAECPLCHKKQSVKNKVCKCGADMDKSKRQKKKVRHWIDFKIPGGKNRREAIGFSIEEARDGDLKRRVQKRENRIFDMLSQWKMTFHDFRRTVKTNILNAGIDKTHRDLILGHALQGMDRHYIFPEEGTLKAAIRKYTRWLDDQIAQVSGNLDQTNITY